ncbi:MAG: hypothetical protein ACE5IE_05245 [Dehalococcoidia bacterium]
MAQYLINPKTGQVVLPAVPLAEAGLIAQGWKPATPDQIQAAQAAPSPPTQPEAPAPSKPPAAPTKTPSKPSPPPAGTTLTPSHTLFVPGIGDTGIRKDGTVSSIRAVLSNLDKIKALGILSDVGLGQVEAYQKAQKEIKAGTVKVPAELAFTPVAAILPAMQPIQEKAQEVWKQWETEGKKAWADLGSGQYFVDDKGKKIETEKQWLGQVKKQFLAQDSALTIKPTVKVTQLAALHTLRGGGYVKDSQITSAKVEQLITDKGNSVAIRTLIDAGFENPQKMISEAQQRLRIREQYADFIKQDKTLDSLALVEAYKDKDLSKVVKELKSVGYEGLTVKQLESLERVSTDTRVLEKYKGPDGFNLIKIYQELNNPLSKLTASQRQALKDATERNFNPDDRQAAEYLALPEVDWAKWHKLSSNTRKSLRPVGEIPYKEWVGYLEKPEYMRAGLVPQVSAAAYAKLGPAAREAVSVKLSAWENFTPWREELGEKASSLGALTLAGEIIVPGVYLARRWGNLKPWERGAGIALDVASIIPGIALLSAGRRAGLGLTRAGGRTLLAEVKAPLTTILHPIQSAKILAYPIETALRLKKLPLSAAELRVHTIKIPVKTIGTPMEAKLARDILMDQALKGKGPTVLVGGRRIVVTPTALQKVTAGVGVHTAGDMRPFLGGAIIAKGREGGLFVSSSLHSRFTIASAFGDMAKKGMPGALIITDKRILSRLVPSGKIYRGTVEMEKVLRAGERLPAPSQILFTRDMSGRKLALLIIGEPLSKRQIAKLKIMGSVDLVRDIFRPSYRIEVRLLDQLADIGKEAKAVEKELKLAKKAGNLKRTKVLKAKLDELNSTARRLTKQIDRATAGRVRAGVLGFGDFLDTDMYRDYATRDPDGFAKWVKGHGAKTRKRILGNLPPRTRATILRRIAAAGRALTRGRTYSGSDESRARLQRYYKARTDRYYTFPAPPDITRLPTTRERMIPRVAVPILRGLQEMPPRTPARVPSKPPMTIPPRLPPGRPYRPKIEIKRVVGRPKTNPGVISWKQGVVRITIKPPYRRGRQDVAYTRIKPPTKGRGSPQLTITVKRGKPPKKIELGMGVTKATIIRGKRIDFARTPKGELVKHRGPGLLRDDGKIVRQKRGSVLV